MTPAFRGLEFQSPTRFVFGFGASAGLASEVRALGGTKALVVTKKSMVDRGDVAPALRSLEDGRVPFVIYDGILPDAPIGLIDEAVELLRSTGCDLVVGLGGGSAMDIAKCVAVAATNEVPVREMLGHGLVPRPGLPKIVVSTTHVAGADTGSAAVLQIDERTHEHGVVDSPYLLAEVVINDPELTLTMTPEATVDTCLDTLVTGIECLTGRQANPLSDLFSESILRICARYLPAVVADGKDREARAQPGARRQHGRLGLHELVHRRRARYLLRSRSRLRAHARAFHGRHPAGGDALQPVRESRGLPTGRRAPRQPHRGHAGA